MNSSFYKVIGNSMYPILKNGDLLNVVKDKSPQIGQIYCFDIGLIVSHRLIGINDTKCIFRGDTNFHNEYVESSLVLGRVVEIYRKKKTIKSFKQKKIKSFVFIILRKIKHLVF